VDSYFFPNVVVSFFQTIYAQDQGFIYGKVTTIDDNTYEGQIRWGKEEAFWTDMFNSAKRENENIRYLSREERDDLHEDHHGKWNLSFDIHHHDSDEFTHQFCTQFGNIATIYFTGRSRVEIELKNGEKLEVSGEGYNDIGEEIRVNDIEIGEIEIRWSRIDKIEFQATPSKLNKKWGDPLFGTVVTYDGEFTGFIQWDHDERITSDELDGDMEDGDISIEFGKIASIEREGGGSNVVLKSGREIYLRGSNDVNSDNRGIIVSNVDYGRADIPWREFKKVTFTVAPNSGPAYTDFKIPKELRGTVKTSSGNSHSGRLVFDLDEAWDLEVFQGNDDDIEYVIPFSNLKKVVPKNYSYSSVELKNGQKLLLGESQDTDERNDGILVFKNSGDPTYIPWDEVEEISFD